VTLDWLLGPGDLRKKALLFKPQFSNQLKHSGVACKPVVVELLQLHSINVETGGKPPPTRLSCSSTVTGIFALANSYAAAKPVKPAPIITT
jgi:hypothetical protein